MLTGEDEDCGNEFRREYLFWAFFLDEDMFAGPAYGSAFATKLLLLACFHGTSWLPLVGEGPGRLLRREPLWLDDPVDDEGFEILASFSAAIA